MPLGKVMPVEWEGGCALTQLAASGFASASLLGPRDFLELGIPVKSDANLDISSYETLAQGFLLVLLLRTISGGRLRVRLPSLSDNVAAESVINRLYTSKFLALFVQRLAMWACAHTQSPCPTPISPGSETRKRTLSADGMSHAPSPVASRSRTGSASLCALSGKSG